MTFVLQFTEPRTLRRMFENMGWNLPEQLAGSSSRSGRNRGAAVESVAIGEQQLKRTQSGTAAKVDTIREQLKRTQSRAAAEANASGEHQLKQMETGNSS